MPDRTTAVCFTGRRPKDLGGYIHKNYDGLLHFLQEYVDAELCQFKTRFITGGAQGFDQLAFWAVAGVRAAQKLPIENVLYLPFPSQDGNWSQTGPFGKEEYRLMKQNATEVRYISDKNPGGYRDAVKFLMARNSAMLSDADTCVGLWTDDDAWQDQNMRSGTASCLRDALKKCGHVQIIRYEMDGQYVRPLRVDTIK